MLDAYTVRKAVPRILLAVIGINLSIYLCLAAVDLSMIIGRGIDSLLTSTFRGSEAFAVVSPETTTEGVLTTLLSGGALWALGGAIVGGILPFITLVGLLALAILFTLIIRQGLLIFLIIVSPVAFACFILPGTEKYFQKWLDLFIRTLMVYPIIMVILGMSKVLASILIGTASLSPDAIGGVKIFAALIVIYAPLALIPFAFKLAGGAIGAVAGMAVGRAQQTGAGIKRGMKENPDSLSNRLRRKADSKYTDKGWTGGQLWAGATGGMRKGEYDSRKEARKARRGAAREFDQFRNLQAENQAGRFKMNAQDSDVQDAMLMSGDDSKKYTQQLASDYSQGKVSKNQYERKMRAHALADSMGRTSANQRAAFLNGDRIKFSENSHAEEVALAERVFGNDPGGVASAMNAHQAIASSVGRADLSQSLYGDPGNKVRGSSKAGAGGIMAGHSTGVKNSISDLLSVVNDQGATVEQRTQAAQALATMRGLAKSPYGQGNEENKRLVREQESTIAATLSTFASDPTLVGKSYLHEQEVKGPVGERQVRDAAGNLTKELLYEDASGNKTSDARQSRQLTPAEAAQKRLDELAGNQVDPAIAAATQQAQQQQGQQGGGTNP